MGVPHPDDLYTQQTRISKHDGFPRDHVNSRKSGSATYKGTKPHKRWNRERGQRNVGGKPSFSHGCFHHRRFQRRTQFLEIAVSFRGVGESSSHGNKNLPKGIPEEEEKFFFDDDPSSRVNAARKHDVLFAVLFNRFIRSNCLLKFDRLKS